MINHISMKSKFLILFVVAFIIAGYFLFFAEKGWPTEVDLDMSQSAVYIVTDKTEYFSNGIVAEMLVMKVINNTDSYIEYEEGCASASFKNYFIGEDLEKDLYNFDISCEAEPESVYLMAGESRIFYDEIVEPGEYQVGFTYKKYEYDNGSEFVLEPVEVLSNIMTINYVEFSIDEMLEFCEDVDFVDNKGGHHTTASCQSYLVSGFACDNTSQALEICDQMTSRDNCYMNVARKLVECDMDEAVDVCETMADSSSDSCYYWVVLFMEDSSEILEMCELFVDENKKENCQKRGAEIISETDYDEAEKLCENLKYESTSCLRLIEQNHPYNNDWEE